MRHEQSKTMKRGEKNQNVNCIMNTQSVCVRIQKGLMRVLRGGALLGGVIAMSR